MNYFRNAVLKLYNAASAPVAKTLDALAKRLQSVRDTVTLLYNRTEKKLGWGMVRQKLFMLSQKRKQNKTTLDSKTSSTCMKKKRRPKKLMMELKICNTYLMAMICG